MPMLADFEKHCLRNDAVAADVEKGVIGADGVCGHAFQETAPYVGEGFFCLRKRGCDVR